jgi:hypothetical protein
MGEISGYNADESNSRHIMNVNSLKNGRHRISLQDVIRYFACTIPHLQEVKLDKLSYIAQLYHYSNYGELLTGNRFFSMSFGPHAPTVRSTVKKQIEKNVLFWEESRTSSDPVYSNPCLIIKSCEDKETGMVTSCLNTLREVVEDWADMPYNTILDYTARTIPYLSTNYREPIDFTAIQPFRELRLVLPLPQRNQIHRFVEEPDKAMVEEITVEETVPLTINEVAEIYLALCGDLPDKIPSQIYLGFNLNAALLAVTRMYDKHNHDANRDPTEFDKAAQLTFALLDSMSFRSYSGRVALKAGMLFLKKLGYSFGGDVLEDHWPKGHSPGALRDWFNRVSVKVVRQKKSTEGGICNE